MPNEITDEGLTIESLNDIITNLENGLKAIYGNDINIDSNSPDGQLINLVAQVKRDLLELNEQIYNSFDPDKAIGRILDERVSINSIQRQAGSYTFQPVEITVDRALNLDGLDDQANDPDGEGYTVSDNNGNEFILLDSQIIASAGTYSFSFRAKNLGKVETLPNTITEPITVILGVTNINNPSVATSIGTDEETDAELRLRREKSVAQGSLGYLDGLLGALLNIEGVVDAIVFENRTGTTDSDGIPSHSIWAIIEGGSNQSIGEELYTRKSYGAGMKGSVQVDIEGENGLIFEAKFDRPSAKDLYIKFDLKQTTGSSFDLDTIKQYLVDNLVYSIGGDAETSQITCVALDGINANGGGGVPINVEISDDDITYVDFLSVSTKDEKWVVDKTKITITIV
jgi:uncharacterized phage protein gp47/JayE